MSSRTITTGLCAVLTLIVACGGGGSVSAPGNPDMNLPAPSQPPAAGILGDGTLNELVEWTRALHGVPAMGVVIVHNGMIVESAAAGLRSASDDERVTTDDLWHIGSLTKNITSSLAGALVEMSVLSWNTRPLDVWPELDGAIHPQLKDITLLQLLSHTAGVPPTNAAPSEYGDLAAGTLVEKRRGFAADLLSQSADQALGSSTCTL